MKKLSKIYVNFISDLMIICINALDDLLTLHSIEVIILVFIRLCIWPRNMIKFRIFRFYC
jgi:hypothetical protein